VPLGVIRAFSNVLSKEHDGSDSHHLFDLKWLPARVRRGEIVALWPFGGASAPVELLEYVNLAAPELACEAPRLCAGVIARPNRWACMFCGGGGETKMNFLDARPAERSVASACQLLVLLMVGQSERRSSSIATIV
jgi:hypothetical protein